MVLALSFAGCGDTKDAKAPGKIVRYEIGAGKLKFEFGEPTDSVVPVPHTVLSVRSDGSGAYKVAGKPKTEVHLTNEELAKLKSDLERIDFEKADAALSGKTREGVPSVTVTSDGTSVHLGDEFFGIARGEGPPVADQMAGLLTRLNGIASP